MKISVVTISYNQAPYLQACIDSIACQQPEWEHIIVDPGSTDGSREIIQRNRSHFAKIILEPDAGPADGLNKGFSAATGTHGFFLNSDDLLLPRAFEEFAGFAQRNSRYDVLLFGGWIIDGDAVPIRSVRPTRTSLRSLLRGSSVMFQQGFLFRMDAFRSTGGFNRGNRTCWDFEFLCDILGSGSECATSAARVGAFRVYPGTISNDARTGERRRAYLADRSRIVRKFLPQRDIGGIVPIIEKYLMNPWLVREKIDERFFRRSLKIRWDNELKANKE